MARTPRRVKLEPNTDLAALVEEMRMGRDPMVLEKDGEEVAVILSPEDYAHLSSEPKSRRNKDKLLSLAGAWADLDATELIEKTYQDRHESPSAPHVSL